MVWPADTSANTDRSSDSDQVELHLLSTGAVIRFWTSYTYQQDFLTPSDAWSFITGDRAAIDAVRDDLIVGAKISLVINDKAQATGYVEKVFIKEGRSGTIMTIAGRDTLGPMVNAGIDPLFSFTEGSTLIALVASVAVPFGFKIISTTDIANRSVITGWKKENVVTSTEVVTQPVRKEVLDPITSKVTIVQSNDLVSIKSQTDPTKPKFLKDITLKQTKPKPGEGQFAFLARLCKRFQLWLWPNSLGDTLIVSEPDMEQKSIFTLRRSETNGVNVEEGTLNVDMTDAPSVIIASGQGGGGDKEHSRSRVAMVNELVGCDEAGNILPEVQEIISRYKGIKVLDIRKELLPFRPKASLPFPVPVYLSDEESKSIGQLEGFVRAEMAKHQSKAVTVEYTIEGHTQDGIPFAVNTIADVDDDALDLHQPMFIKSREFTKSRSGTFTKLGLVPLHMIDIG